MTVRPCLRLALLAVVACARVSQPPVSGPAPAPVGTAPVVWAPALDLPSLGELPARLAARFPEPFDVAVLGADGSPKQASMPNCAAYFDLRPKGYEPLSQPDLAAMKTAGATCWALKALEMAKPAAARPLRPFPLTETVLARLPPLLGPTGMPADRERRVRAKSEGKTWGAFDPDARVVPKSDWAAQVKGKDWTTDLDVLALGDLNGDGVDDMLIAEASTGSEGSWSEVRLRLLSTVEGNPLLHVVKEYPL